MKIKAKEGYRAIKHAMGRLHIIHANKLLTACGKDAHVGNFPGNEVREFDKSKVCKNCLKNTDAWEPVEDEYDTDAWEPVEEQHDCDKFKAGDRVKVVKRVGGFNDGWKHGWDGCWSTSMDKFIGTEGTIKRARGKKGFWLEGTPHYFPSQALELVKAAEPVAEHQPPYVDRKLLENAEAELERLEEVNKLLSETTTNQNEQLEQKTKDFAESCKDLDERNQELKKERDEVKEEREALKRYGAEDQKTIEELKRDMEGVVEENRKLVKNSFDLYSATAGHTPENIATIMGGMPSADELNGMKVDEVELTAVAYPYFYSVSVRCTPIAEWIENDDITDEMVVKAGGRVPCEVQTSTQGWEEGQLVAVEKFSNDPAIVMLKDGACEHVKLGEVRIKKSDLEQS